jgi:LysR family glycine cleavage system transcriptional activator
MVDRPRLQRLPLGGLLAFEAAARLGSFKSAAMERSVTPAAISHQVKAIEANLGALLFVRLNRGLRLTAAGARLADVCSGCFAQIDKELDRLRGEGVIASATTLAVSAAPTFATKWLAPRLHRFLDANPTIDVRLNAENEMRSPGRDPQVDLSVRYGLGPYGEELVAEPLWDRGTIVPVCASNLLTAYPAPPREVAALTLLRVDLPPVTGDAEKADWLAWLKAAKIPLGEIGPRAMSGPTFGNHNLAIEAAASGRGVALAPLILVIDEIRSGRLAVASSLFLEDPNRFWILYARARETSAIRSFTRWLRQQASIAAQEADPALAH